jgi:hypothetical protein
MHELGHAKQYYEFVRNLNRPAHSESVEEAWGAFALSPGSSEPDNVGRHERPITEFHLGGYRKRYYHDAFHFGKQNGSFYSGWASNRDVNYNLTLVASEEDSFIFTNKAKQDDFNKLVDALEVFDTAKLNDYANGQYVRTC